VYIARVFTTCRRGSSDVGRQRFPSGLADVRYPVNDGEHHEAQWEQGQRHLVQGAPLRPAVQYDVFGEQLESQFARCRRRRALSFCRLQHRKPNKKYDSRRLIAHCRYCSRATAVLFPAVGKPGNDGK
jgi:hypothetical protein